MSRHLSLIGERGILIQEFDSGGWLVTYLWTALDTGEQCEYSEACSTFEEMRVKVEVWLHDGD